MDRRGFTKAMALTALAPWKRVDPGVWPCWNPSWPAITDSFNVRHFGAKGDGVTDDRGAFVLAIAAAAIRGGTVFVPDGAYRMSQTLHLASGVVLQGTGAASVITHVGGDPLVIVSGDTRQVAVQDLTISGQFAHGVLFERSTNATLARCHISGATMPYVGNASGAFIAGCNGVTIQACLFDGNGGGEAKWSSDIQCDGLGAASSGIRMIQNECVSTSVSFNIRCYDLSRSEISGNIIQGAKIHGPANHGYGILIYPTQPRHDTCFENVVIGNKLSHTQGTGIYLVRCDRSRVEDNQIDDVATVQADALLPVAGIALNQSQYVTVLRNTISNSGRAGISVTSDRAGVGHIDVRDNLIADAAGYGIHLRGILRDVHVVANKISRTSGGIGGDTKDEQDDIEIRDNILDSIKDRPAIRLPNASRSTVTKNTVRDAANYGLDLDFRDDESVAAGNSVRNAGTMWGKGGDSVHVVRKGKPTLERP